MTKRKNKKKKNLFIIGIVSVLLIGGLYLGVTKIFNNSDSLDSEIDNKDSKNNKKPEEPKVQIVDVNSKSRPYAVMINNIGAARPYHIGLQDAYLVYEIIVEGGITRYLALFKDNLPEMVGSVRSARHYYLDYVLENDAYYIHWGWSPQAKSDISSLKINNLNGLSSGSPYFFRKKYSASLGSEHTGYANLKEMTELVEKKNYRTETNKALLLKYSAKNIDLSDKDDVQEATNIDLKYSNSYITNYVYDSDNKVYKQFVNDKEHIDYDTTKQYTVKNIITYQVSNKSISGDDKGRQDIDNIGDGEGYYITEGKAVPITWEKSSRSAQTIYKYKDGTKLTVNDGNTWIHIVPTSGDIGIS